MRAIVVGHGPSAFFEDHDIDSYDVVIRLKQAKTGGSLGTKTTAIVASKPHWKQPDIPFWLFAEHEGPYRRIDKQRWMRLFQKYKPTTAKPSNGLVALFAVKEFLDLDEVSVVGFDVIRDCPGNGLASHNGSLDQFQWWHDFKAERRCADDLFSRIEFL